MKAIFRTATVIIASMIFASTAFAQDEEASSPAQAEEPQKVDVQNLEKRYWAPKDKKFKVVQNRTYTKTKKVSLSVMPSLMLNEEYSKGFGVSASVGYYFTDRWGLELEYQSMSLEDNDLQDEVVNLGGFANHGKTTNYFGVTGRWMPFYAKMSFLGTKIVYFDLSLGLSMGMMNYEQQFRGNDPAVEAALAGQNLDQSAFAVGFDVSQSFYLSKKLLLRVDYKHRFFTEDIIVGGTTAPGTSAGDRQEDSISLNLGVTYLF
jgi:outer membrane beta-barrel protein